MTDNKILKHIETEFVVELDNNHDAEIIYNSISPEVTYARNDRSVTDIELKENKIILTINSKDVVSLRASINSYVRWINLSLEILKI